MPHKHPATIILALIVALLSGSTALASAHQYQNETIKISEHPDVGTILTDTTGRTLYLFTEDDPNVSNCTADNGCSNVWPPLLIDANATPTGEAGVTGVLGTISRDDGTTQVTYDQMPLYTYAPDTNIGDAKGQGQGGNWYVVHPERASMTTKFPVIRTTNDPTLGEILKVQGFTMYYFRNDEPGKSNCNGPCADAWPPLLVPEGGVAKLEDGIPGKFATITRDDGATQITYNDLPLYYFAQDAHHGDTKGHESGDVWFAQKPKDPPPPPIVKVSNHPEEGQILTDMDGRTLYLFTNDEPNQSNCNNAGACDKAWPPLLVGEGITPTGTVSVTGQLGTIERADGSRQVTYAQMPLYFYAPDTNPGDAKGQDSGGVWYVVHPDRSQMTIKFPVIRTTEDTALGTILNVQGYTVYYFRNDEPNKSNCSDACAELWPPLLVPADGVASMEGGIPGQLTTLTRDDGTTQLVYNGLPLYFYAPDAFHSNTKGHEAGDVWFVQKPQEAQQPPKVIISEHPVYGPILTSASGRVIYLFTPDEPNVSNCSGGCATAWPPVPMPAGETPTGGEGVTGKLGTIERADGIIQVTYDEMPLYYYAPDTDPLAVTGHGQNNVWFLVHADRAKMTVEKPVVRVKNDDELGNILMNQGFTLYYFRNDEPGKSNCNGGCADLWPPLTVPATGTVSLNDGISGTIGTITRDDGSIQVAYNDQPLYFYALDAFHGDTRGHGISDVWFARGPAGCAGRSRSNAAAQDQGQHPSRLWRDSDQRVGSRYLPLYQRRAR